MLVILVWGQGRGQSHRSRSKVKVNCLRWILRNRLVKCSKRQLPLNLEIEWLLPVSVICLCVCNQEACADYATDAANQLLILLRELSWFWLISQVHAWLKCYFYWQTHCWHFVMIILTWLHYHALTFEFSMIQWHSAWSVMIIIVPAVYDRY